MIYRINGKYYVKVGSQYREIKLEIKNDELVIIPIGTGIEVNSRTRIEPIIFAEEKEHLKKMLGKRNNRFMD